MASPNMLLNKYNKMDKNNNMPMAFQDLFIKFLNIAKS